MPTIGAPLRKWTPFLLLLCSLPPFACAQPTNEITTPELNATSLASSASVASSLSKPVTQSPETACPSRTINYITHTLPQQCLKTSWSASGQAVSAEAPEMGAAAMPSQHVEIPWAREEVPEHSEVVNKPASASPTYSESDQSASVAAASPTSIPSEPEAEADSPLDNANFLSFEEWKMKNLARAGQSPENVGQARAANSEARARRRPVNINALDSLGEEAEIEIDFGGFGNPNAGNSRGNTLSSGAHDDQAGSTKTTDEAGKVAPSSWELSKDAGKTCKERFNYASFDCAATVLKTNGQAKSSSAVLVENKDSYMLNECSADNKFVIVELCDDILVDTIVLANYEFFSSMFRHFRVSVSDRYPVKMDRWRTLGTFEARNSREIQPFLVTEPQIWARYLRIELITHYGNEFYCPMSLLRVHGTTMLEQFRREEEEARGVDDFAEPIEEAADGESVKSAGDNVPVSSGDVLDTPEKNANVPIEASVGEQPPEPATAAEVPSSPVAFPEPSSTATSGEPAVHSGPSDDTTSSQGEGEGSEAPNDTSLPPTASASSKSNDKEIPANESQGNTVDTPSTGNDQASSAAPNSGTENKPPGPTAVSLSDGLSSKIMANDTATMPSSSPSKAASGSNSTANNGAQAPSQQRASSQTQPNPASPTTQESFFKSIHKRLQQLEANSTLSLQYIEEQSRILRDAFMKVEKRQLAKTEKFLDHLNSTVMQELKSYRSMYDQLWQSTILELESMKERQRSEVGEIGARLSLVADELVWQKRMAVVQSTLLLLCLGLVLFVRSGTLGGPQSDVPIVQQLGNRYNSFFDTPPHSPGNSALMKRRRTFRNIWRSDTSAGLSERGGGHLSDGGNALSDAETDGHRTPAQMGFGPSTPPVAAGVGLGQDLGSSPEQSNGVGSVSRLAATQDDEEPVTPKEESDNSFEEEAKRVQVLATQSGPATPRGSRDHRPSWEEVDKAVDLLKAEEQGRGDQVGRQIDMEKRRKKRSPLRRAESYDGTTDESSVDTGREYL